MANLVPIVPAAGRKIVENLKNQADFEEYKIKKLKAEQQKQSQITKHIPTPPVLLNQDIKNRIKSKPIIRNSQANDFKRRHEEYEKNRACGRGVNNIFADKKSHKNAAYEENLRRIRLKNYNNRKPICSDKIIKTKENYKIRKEKIDSLKQQAEEKKNKLDLEHKRQHDYKIDQKFPLDDYKAPKILISPVPPINMTEALSAIGVVGKQINKDDVLKDPLEKNNNRKSWQKITDLTPLDNKTLIDQSIALPVSPRKIWDIPNQTLIKKFHDASLILPDNNSENDTLYLGEQITSKKQATLKTSVNILLEVTLGQFDLKNTNVRFFLIFCSINLKYLFIIKSF